MEAAAATESLTLFLSFREEMLKGRSILCCCFSWRPLPLRVCLGCLYCTRVCLCMYVCVCMYVCLHVCLCMYVCMYVCICTCMLYVCACMYVYVCKGRWIGRYVCVNACPCLHVIKRCTIKKLCAYVYGLRVFTRYPNPRICTARVSVSGGRRSGPGGGAAAFPAEVSPPLRSEFPRGLVAARRLPAHSRAAQVG